jgi:hypothetical protein
MSAHLHCVVKVSASTRPPNCHPEVHLHELLHTHLSTETSSQPNNDVHLININCITTYMYNYVYIYMCVCACVTIIIIYYQD